MDFILVMLNIHKFSTIHTSANFSIAILAGESQREEILAKAFPKEIMVEWVADLKQLVDAKAEAFFDLLFRPEENRVEELSHLLPKPVFIHAVSMTLSELGKPFIRLNAWPGFLQREILELAFLPDAEEQKASSVMERLGWNYKRIADLPGFVAGRVVAMLVNEAFFTLEQGVSTQEEIDLAMKTGTNYPMGPFEWSRRIGLKNIYELLLKLSVSNPIYTPSEKLVRTCAGI